MIKQLKFWGKIKYKNFQLIIIIKNSWKIFSLLLLEDKNILIASQVNGLNFYDVKIWKNLFIIKETCCGFWNCLKRIDDDRIICGGKDKNELKIIKISKKKLIQTIKNDFACLGIYVINSKNAILIGGDKNNNNYYNINIYNSIDYSLIIKIEKAHSDQIYCFVELKNGNIASCSADGTIRVWTYNVE